jgi:hypothetical protein
MIETIIIKDRDFLVNAPLSRSKYFIGAGSFTRDRCLDYQGVAMNIINLPRRTLAVELEDYFERIGSQDLNYTKGAFSHARKKIAPVFFKDWYEEQNKYYYDHFEIQTWQGHRLVGIDGARAYLFNTKEMLDVFGSQGNHHMQIAMAQLLVGHDLLNDVCLFSDIGPANTSETSMLLPWLDQMPKDVLCIYDRLFPSVFLIYLHLIKGLDFVMRCKLSFNQVIKDFVAGGALDMIVDFPINAEAAKQLRELGYETGQNETVKVRLLSIVLDSGQIEVLITSLLDDKKYPHALFKGLYAMRWGVETGIGRLKNQLQIEIFSGRSPLAVQQDFYATIFTYNLQSIFIRSLDRRIEQINKRRKHNYQINRNVTLGILKGRMIRLFIEPIDGLIDFLQRKFIQHLTEQTKYEGRQCPRKKKAQRLNGKYRTLTNYKRAI